MGLPFLSLMDVLEEADCKPDILKLGVVYPVARGEVCDFLAAHDEVKILEELDNLLEMEVKSIALDAGLKTKIIGKTDDQDWVGEYTPGQGVCRAGQALARPAAAADCSGVGCRSSRLPTSNVPGLRPPKRLSRHQTGPCT